eukprot:557171-Prymnesium_polylepis.1
MWLFPGVSPCPAYSVFSQRQGHGLRGPQTASPLSCALRGLQLRELRAVGRMETTLLHAAGGGMGKGASRCVLIETLMIRDPDIVVGT